jgi:hypothetical protein
MITYHLDYLYSFELSNIDNTKLTNNCIEIEKDLLKIFGNVDDNWYGNKSSALNQKYNLFTFPHQELIKLYKAMVEHISPLLDTNRGYVIKSWMNLYRKGQNVKWHSHWPKEYNVWHGFYCVNVGNDSSHTIYKIPGVVSDIIVPSINGRLVVGKSENDKHSSSIWQDESSPRITLAFDIIPIDTLINDKLILNHFIPFKS